MEIIGLRIEKYIGREVSSRDEGTLHSEAEFEKHIICAILSDNRKVEIELSSTQGECLSGYCAATWSDIKVTNVIRFRGYTHTTKNPLVIEDILSGFEGYAKNQVFEIDTDGSDPYYPCGHYTVNMDLFVETIRHKSIRPVWIFTGKSNSGKSFISGHLKELQIYETDVSDVLPDNMVESVIVLGNKYNFTIEDVKQKLFGEVEVIVVTFN